MTKYMKYEIQFRFKSYIYLHKIVWKWKWFSKERGKSCNMANYSEILHSAHLGNNQRHTAWFIKFRGKYFFEGAYFFYITIYLYLICICNRVNKKTYFSNDFSFKSAYLKSCFWMKRFNFNKLVEIIWFGLKVQGYKVA